MEDGRKQIKCKLSWVEDVSWWWNACLLCVSTPFTLKKKKEKVHNSPCAVSQIPQYLRITLLCASQLKRWLNMGPHGKTLLLKTTHAFRRERTTEKVQDIKKSSQTNQEMLSLLASSRRAGPCCRHLLGNYTLTGPSGSSKNLKDMKYW